MNAQERAREHAARALATINLRREHRWTWRWRKRPATVHYRGRTVPRYPEVGDTWTTPNGTTATCIAQGVWLVTSNQKETTSWV